MRLAGVAAACCTRGGNLADLLSLLAAGKDDADEIDAVLVTTEEAKAISNPANY